jgi:hypothetical protein
MSYQPLVLPEDAGADHLVIFVRGEVPRRKLDRYLVLFLTW